MELRPEEVKALEDVRNLKEKRNDVYLSWLKNIVLIYPVLDVLKQS